MVGVSFSHVKKSGVSHGGGGGGLGVGIQEFLRPPPGYYQVR